MKKCSTKYLFNSLISLYCAYLTIRNSYKTYSYEHKTTFAAYKLIKMNIKRPSDSLTIMTELVMPNDTNIVGNLLGGRLLHWMDICAAIAAQKHCKHVAVTASVNNVSFQTPIKLGDTVSLLAKVVRAFNTSMEVHIEVWAENLVKGTKLKSNDAFFTFVAIDNEGKPIKIPAIQPLSDDEQELYEQSLIRRQLKLLMANKLKLDKAPELKAQIEGWK